MNPEYQNCFFFRMIHNTSTFQTHDAVSEEELTGFIDSAASIDPAIPDMVKNQTLNKAKLKNCRGYHEKLAAHCFQGHYCFQVGIYGRKFFIIKYERY